MHSNKIHVSSHPNKLQFAPYQNEIFVSYYGSNVIEVYDGLDLDETRFFSLKPYSILDISLDPNEFNGWKNLLFVTLIDDFNNKTGNVRVIDTDAFKKNLPKIVYESQIYNNKTINEKFNNS